MEVNRPDIVAEVSALCAMYDAALKANDVAALVDYFWDDERALRIGVSEELYGAKAISAFRQGRVVNFNGRTNLREQVTTFGDSMAIATVEFSVATDAAPRQGRQSQIWIRFADVGWKIVSAHVSHRLSSSASPTAEQSPTAAYVAAVSALLAMPVDPAHASGVIRDLEVMEQLFAPLMALDLSASESAPVFVA